jgi:hypothetical protein
MKIYKIHSRLAIKQAKHDGDGKMVKTITTKYKSRLKKFAHDKKKTQHKYYILMLSPLKAKLRANRRKA